MEQNETCLPGGQAPAGGPAAEGPAAGEAAAREAELNAMAQKLKEREEQLQREMELAHRRADIISGYTDMLVDLLSQRDEWLMIVDMETREIIHCNKRPQDSTEGSVFCDQCMHRLPIQSNILQWDASERYKVWEIEAGQRTCYRVISFPIEWQERPSCVHIVMDVTAEKMAARHLSDKVYHDMDTGIRNRQFLDEFMGQVLRKRQDATLCYLDLEGVEDINTTFGHKVGDAYIQNFVEIVRKNFRSSDTFARIRDDRFCLVLTGNVKHLIERKMADILAMFQRDDDRIFSHRCNFKYSIIEIEGETNEMTLEELLAKAEAGIRRKKKKRRAFEFDDW